MRKESIVAVSLERRGFLTALYLCFKPKQQNSKEELKHLRPSDWSVCYFYPHSQRISSESGKTFTGPSEGKHSLNVFSIICVMYTKSPNLKVPWKLLTDKIWDIMKCNMLIYLFWCFNTFSTVLSYVNHSLFNVIKPKSECGWCRQLSVLPWTLFALLDVEILIWVLNVIQDS